MTFPNLKNGQYALLRCDPATGHVLDANNQLKLSESQTAYALFESIEEALTFATQLSESNIECVIYDHAQTVVSVIPARLSVRPT